MFEQLRQLKQLKDLQNSLEKERIEFEKNGNKVIINGNMEIEKLQLNPSLSKEEQEKNLKDCINEAMKKIKIVAAQKMSQMI